jgi:predicted aspartyl protease
VDVSINGGTRARLVLETEAEVTQIKPAVLASAGITLPADGGQSPSVTLDSLTLGEARVTRLPVVAQDVRPGEDGLLGRDFLDRFTVANDPQGGVLTLTPR